MRRHSSWCRSVLSSPLARRACVALADKPLGLPKSRKCDESSLPGYRGQFSIGDALNRCIVDASKPDQLLCELTVNCTVSSAHFCCNRSSIAKSTTPVALSNAPCLQPVSSEQIHRCCSLLTLITGSQQRLRSGGSRFAADFLLRQCCHTEPSEQVSRSRQFCSPAHSSLS